MFTLGSEDHAGVSATSHLRAQGAPDGSDRIYQRTGPLTAEEKRRCAEGTPSA